MLSRISMAGLPYEKITLLDQAIQFHL
jgi:hypothetical protein